MLTKGEIISIDYAGNTCRVAVPFFDTVSTSLPTTIDAVFAIPPGFFNGYKVGDIVEVGFEDHSVHNGVVVGKLFLSTAQDSISTSSIFGNNLNISQSASIPITTSLTCELGETEVANTSGISRFKSIKDLAISLNELEITQNTNSLNNLGNSFNTIVCRSLTTNLMGYTITDYSTKHVPEENCYYILYKNKAKLSKEIALNYMYYMTGSRVLPKKLDTKVYNGAFLTIDLQKFYPSWDEELGFLRLHYLVESDIEKIEDKIRRIIEEEKSDMTLTNLTTDPVETISDDKLTIFEDLSQPQDVYTTDNIVIKEIPKE